MSAVAAKEKPVAPAVIQNVPLFRGLNETECRQVAEIAQTKEFAPGEVIIRQGQQSQELWILLEGKCDVLKMTDALNRPTDHVVLAHLEPNSHFGEMSFFHTAPHSASVRAQTAVKLLKIARGDYEELIQDGCRAAYKLAYNTVASLAERLRKMDEWVAELMADASQASSLQSTSPQPSSQPPSAGGNVPEWNNFREKMMTSWNM